MLPSEPSNFCRYNFHFEVSMEVSLPNAPRCISYVSGYIVLKSLCYGGAYDLATDVVSRCKSRAAVMFAHTVRQCMDRGATTGLTEKFRSFTDTTGNFLNRPGNRLHWFRPHRLQFNIHKSIWCFKLRKIPHRFKHIKGKEKLSSFLPNAAEFMKGLTPIQITRQIWVY